MEIAFAVPVLEGKEGLDREVLSEMQSGRREEVAAAMRDAGMRRQRVWHQRTPQGTVAVVVMELEEEGAEQRFTTSDAPVVRWFVEQMQEVHGFDISAAPPDVELVFDVAS